MPSPCKPEQGTRSTVLGQPQVVAAGQAVPNAGTLGWHPWDLWGAGWVLLLSAQVAGGSRNPRRTGPVRGRGRA